MKSKLKRFEINAGRDNVVEPGKEIFLKVKGQWKDLYFKNQNPLTVELACGRGEYSLLNSLVAAVNTQWVSHENSQVRIS